MAVNLANHAKVRRLSRFSVTTGDALGLATFYESAFGCRRLASERLSGSDFERLMGVKGGADCITLGLGQEILDLLQFDRPGQPYPSEASSSDLIFQHFAIVVSDIAQAYQRLSALPGWTAISVDGPQRLPATSGGVAAFKFRDPDGHPLELLAFPDNKIPPHWQAVRHGAPCLGIDHSALSVSDDSRSIAFYEALGCTVSGRSLNQGPEQARLDGLSEPYVKITALSAGTTTPHIELLCYRSVARSHGIPLRNNDVAATRLVLEASGNPLANAQSNLFDPDGHHLMIIQTQ